MDYLEADNGHAVARLGSLLLLADVDEELAEAVDALESAST